MGGVKSDDFKYSGDLTTEHLNTKQIEIQFSNGLLFRSQVPEIQSSEYRTGFQKVKHFWLPS
jgi:hypothetical protein